MYGKDERAKMKKRDLERQLSNLGWKFSHHGGSHDIWTNGEKKEAVPRHREIKEYTAKKILKTAQEHPPKGK
jgi:mRNA interferase HicA